MRRSFRATGPPSTVTFSAPNSREARIVRESASVSREPASLPNARENRGRARRMSVRLMRRLHSDTRRNVPWIFSMLSSRFFAEPGRGKPHSPELKPPAQQVDVRAVDFTEQTRGLFQARLEG